MPQPRNYGAETQASDLVMWLNQARSASHLSYERLLKLRTLLGDASDLSMRYRRLNPRGDLGLPEFVVEAENLKDKINHLVRGYRLQPHANELRLSAHRWFFGWETPGKRTFTAMIPGTIPGYEQQGRREFGEASALMKLIEISQSGYLDRVKTCEQCAEWFYAKFSHARFCTRACQQNHFRSSSEFKAHKAQYMKDQRKQRNERERRARIR
jgi:hypothetical protein